MVSCGTISTVSPHLISMQNQLSQNLSFEEPSSDLIELLSFNCDNY